MIDLVVPYVNFQDENWIKTAKENNIDYSEIIRFRGQGNFFKYFFRGIAKNIPWINNIFLIVQSESQVPKWLDKTKIKVVLHKDFIPNEFLPLYNSCTIEMFLGNIKELNEKFLYFNDDMYILRKLQPESFFIGNKAYLNFEEGFPTGKPYSNHCINGYNLIFDEGSKIPQHSVKPLFKSKVIECYNLYKNEIYNSITKLRTEKNFNVYLFCYYMLKNNLYQNSKNKFIYTTKYDSRFVNAILNADILCLGDVNPRYNIFEDVKINKRFNELFKEKCKYEL